MSDRFKNCRVLLLYKSLLPSVRLCGLLQFEKLCEDGQLAFRHKKVMDVKEKDLNWANLVVFIRGDSRMEELIAEQCYSAGKCLIYVLDDDLFNVPMTLESGPYFAQESVKEQIRRILKYSHCFLSPSPVLLEKYGGQCKYSFQLTEPAACRLKEKRRWMDGKIHIGFAGSSDRGGDIDQLISEALTEIKARYGEKISLEIFGPRTGTAEKLGCKTYPYMESYEEYQETMGRLNWDIGLAPMPETAFHACKHYNKLVEYCGFGIVGVYSDVPPYSAAVEQGVTGLLTRNTTQAWVEALSRLIEDEELRREMAENCLQRARDVFSIERSAKQLIEHLAKLDIPVDTKPMRGRFVWIKIQGLFAWFMEKLKKYGLKTPLVAVQKLLERMGKKK